MKAFPHSVAAAIILLSACGPVRDRQTLNYMEALMPERPDSALTILQGMKIRDMPGLHVHHFHALLLSEALDKNYIDLTDDSLAIFANRYYDSHGTRLHRLKSWYYLGRVRFNSRNYAEAVICYDKALEFAEELTSYHYIGLINREIANAYSEAWDNFHAIEYIRKSIDAFDCAGEQTYSDYSRLALARMLRSQSDYKASEAAIDQLLCHVDDDYLEACAYEVKGLNALSNPSTSNNDALYYLRKAGIGSILGATPVRLSNLAYAHELAGNKDSTALYLNNALSSITSRSDSIFVLYSQYRIAEAAGNYIKAFDLYKEYNSLQTPATYQMLEQSISFHQGNYYQNETRINEVKARMRALTSGFVIVLLIIVSACLLSRNRKQKLLIIAEMAETAEIREDLDSMRNKKQEMGRMLATLFENRISILQTLSEQYELIDESHQRKMREKGRELSKEEIVSSFRDNLRYMRNDKDINLSMEEALNVWKDGIMYKFRAIFGEGSSSRIQMSKGDFELAPYLFSGMKQKTISYFTGYTEHAIKERKYRIRQRIEALDDTYAEDKALFLSNL